MLRALETVHTALPDGTQVTIVGGEQYADHHPAVAGNEAVFEAVDDEPKSGRRAAKSAG